MGYIDMLSPKGYGFSAVLVINRVSIVVILFLNRVWFFCTLVLLLGMLFRGSYVFIIIVKAINKALQTNYIWGNNNFVPKVFSQNEVGARAVINRIANCLVWS